VANQHISTNCPSCAARLKVPAQAAGKRVRCPKCQNAFQVAQPAAPDSPPAGGGLDDDLLAGLATGAAVESPAARRARYEAIAAQAARAGKTPPAAEADEDGVPRPRRSVGAWLLSFAKAFVPIEVAGRACFAMLLGGGALVSFGFKSAAVQTRWHAQPQVVSCADLVGEDAPDNVHVLLTDFVLLSNYVYEQKVGKWEGAWVPAVPRADVEAAVARVLKVDATTVSGLGQEQIDQALDKVKAADFNVKLLVWFPSADGKQYMERAFAARSVEGTLLTNQGLGKLSTRKRKLLEDMYPRSDWRRCWVLEEGPAPKATSKARAYQVGGSALVLLALVIAAWQASRQSA